MRIVTSVEHWPFRQPFRIAGHTFDAARVLVVTVESDGFIGRGEASGVYYRNETPEQMAMQVQRVAIAESRLACGDLAVLMAPGGARNALDCALWDLAAKEAGEPVWKLAGLNQIKPLLTTFTLGADDPGNMAEMAKRYAEARALKIKLVGDDTDAERVTAVRAARPDVWIGVDANQAFTPVSYRKLLPALVAARVGLVEQPFQLERDDDLVGLRSPIPIAADESVQDSHDLKHLKGLVDVVNIKLDKSGGLTEALAMVAEARRLDLRPMVGFMTGTSLAVGPGFVLGQLCDFVDLDGPIFLANDRSPAATYTGGYLSCPEGVWGSGKSTDNTD